MYVWDGLAYVPVGGGGGGTSSKLVVSGRNTSGAVIPMGTPVMATGTIGNNGVITIAPMDGTDPNNYKYYLGVANADIAQNATGAIVDTGKVRGFDTTEWAEGDVLYISTTEVGKFTNVEPLTGLKMPTAFVVTSESTNGEIMVRVTPVDENAHIRQTFETVSKNLAASDVTLNYTDGDLTSLVYANGITKTLSYTSGNLTTITLSGATPNGIDMVKTLAYSSGGDLTGISYA
jgi:hypothetical protein